MPFSEVRVHYTGTPGFKNAILPPRVGCYTECPGAAQSTASTKGSSISQGPPEKQNEQDMYLCKEKEVHYEELAHVIMQVGKTKICRPIVPGQVQRLEAS